jgi:hypothetical protein
VIAFGNGNFLAAWATTEAQGKQGLQRLQLFSADGSRNGYPIHTIRLGELSNRPRISFGAGRFCVLYPHFLSDERTLSLMVDHEEMEPPALVNLRRTTNGSIAVESSRTYRSWDGNMHARNESIETSTNGVDWTAGYPRWWNYGLTLRDLPTLPEWPIWIPDGNGSYVPAITNITERHQLFVRVADHKWPCIEQMRSLDWAKQQWAVDNKKVNTDTPADLELFGSSRYLPAKPACPQGGVYGLGSVQSKPVCSIGLNHTL